MIQPDLNIKVIIADDHALYRAGVKTALASKGIVRIIAEADDGKHLLEILKKVTPDVILLDIQMPRLDGITVMPLLKKLYPDVKVIMLTMMDDLSMVNKLMALGANGYLTKTSDSEIIFEAIKTCYFEGYYFNSLTKKALALPFKEAASLSKSLNYLEPQVSFNQKEIEIIKLMCEEKATREIANIVDLSPRTVEAIRDKIKEKVGVKSTAGIIMYAIKHKILSVDDSNEAGEKLLTLSRDQMAKLFSLSTSILAYINHDLAGQRNALYFSLNQIRDYNVAKIRNENITNQLEKTDEALTKISSITTVIKSHFYWRAHHETLNFNELFISHPAKIVEIVRQRYPAVNIEIKKSAKTSLEIVYPPQILLSILSEFTQNAKKTKQGELKILIDWRIEDEKFKCEFHDDGPGFSEIMRKNLKNLRNTFPATTDSTGGLGLNIINKTIKDSGGTVSFSSSEILGGAMLYFEFPVDDFKNKTVGNSTKEYNLSTTQMAKLFSLSTSILAYINHDLAGQKNILYIAVSQIIQTAIAFKGDIKDKVLLSVIELAEKSLESIEKIHSISNVIKSHFYIHHAESTTDFDKLFLCLPLKIVEIVQRRYKDVRMTIDENAVKALEIVYPPQILLAIISELTENAKKNSPGNLEIFITWRMSGSVFKCEFHDNGPGFSGIKSKKFVPITTHMESLEEKVSGMGLGIINRTIYDSGGNLFLSHSELLKGAMVYFEFPVIDFKPKNISNG